MEPFVTHSGRAVSLRRSNVDTDQIIPAEYLKRVSRAGFADGLFAAWRADPEFVLNRPEFAGATILIAGPNFGIGSSREHAVWALVDYGFRVVISERFGDIFRNNSTRSGLVPAQVEAEVATALMALVEASPDTEMTVEVDRLTIEVPATGFVAPFTLDLDARDRLLKGLDDIGLTLGHLADIDEYESHRRDTLPSLL